MSQYIDGFVLAVPKAKLDDYVRVATKAGAIWKEHGALEYRECAGDDMIAKDMVSFPELAKAGADEVVIFAYAVFESRAHRDAVNEKIMSDERLKSMCEETGGIFDYQRMAYGGFTSIVKF